MTCFGLPKFYRDIFGIRISRKRRRLNQIPHLYTTVNAGFSSTLNLVYSCACDLSKMFASQWQKEASVYLVISKRLADTEDEKWIAPSHTVASIHKVWYFADLLSPAKTFLCKNDWLGYYQLLSCQTIGFFAFFVCREKKGSKWAFYFYSNCGLQKDIFVCLKNGKNLYVISNEWFMLFIWIKSRGVFIQPFLLNQQLFWLWRTRPLSFPGIKV